MGSEEASRTPFAFTSVAVGVAAVDPITGIGRSSIIDRSLLAKVIGSICSSGVESSEVVDRVALSCAGKGSEGVVAAGVGGSVEVWMSSMSQEGGGN